MIFETIREYLNNDFERYISEWFPNVIRINNSTWKTGDFNDTKTKRGDGSLVFNIREKYTKDFSTGETAGDIISIYAHRFCNGSQKKALKELIERYNLASMVESYYPKKDKTETNLIDNNNIDNNNIDNNDNLKEPDDTIEQIIEQETIPLNITNELKTKNKKLTREDLEKDSKIRNISNKKETKVKANETLKEKLKSLDINYTLDNDNNIIYNIGEFNLKTTLHKLKQLKNKHFFYLIPEQKGYDANDLLKENKLKELLLDTPLKEIESEDILKLNKRSSL